MTTLVVCHQVDDVEHWLASPRREQMFAPLGITARAFADPAGSHWTGLIMDVPDMKAWQAAKRSPSGIAAMELDGVQRDTIIEMIEPGADE